MADFIEVIGHFFVGSPSVTLSKTFSPIILNFKWFLSRETILGQNIYFAGFNNVAGNRSLSVPVV
jgi:ABC-type glucose/galactose transport system permease subunit